MDHTIPSPRVPGARLPLQGAPNFRDLGGYATSDHRQVCWRQLYRSGHLADLTEQDYALVAGLGIRLVCDFRFNGEGRPTKWQGPNAPEMLALEAVTQPPAVANAPPKAAADAPAFFEATYEWMVVAFASSYGAGFQRVLDSSGPVLFHCSAGKDRTGLFCALLLRLLGVPLDTVFEDYLLTNTYFEPSLLDADRSYLEKAFQTIDQRFVSLDEYRRTALKLTDPDLERLKDRLLEPISKPAPQP
jgi:protein-tyrosine phosphatase